MSKQRSPERWKEDLFILLTVNWNVFIAQSVVLSPGQIAESKFHQ